MDYNKIILELLGRIQDLENRVDLLEKNKQTDSTFTNSTKSTILKTEKISPKYRDLAEYLLESNEKKVSLSYPQIERILGFSLPDSATTHIRQFWANAEKHPQSSSWLAIGYKTTNIDVENQIITFKKDIEKNY